MRPSSIILYSAILGGASTADPWYFTWTDPSNQSHPESGSRPSDCIEIDNPKGRYFDWEAGDGWCIYFWEDPNCSGTAGAGHTCNTWPWRANATHHNLRAFKVVANGSDYMSSPSSATTAASTGTGTDTSAPTSQSSNNANGGSLSNGAIAGIVVGVVVGVAILAASVWLFWKRRQKPPSNTEPPPGSTASDTRETGKEKAGTQELDSPSGASELHNEPKKKVVELMGSDGLVEMSDTHRVVELDTIETTVGRLPEKS